MIYYPRNAIGYETWWILFFYSRSSGGFYCVHGTVIALFTAIIVNLWLHIHIGGRVYHLGFYLIMASILCFIFLICKCYSFLCCKSTIYSNLLPIRPFLFSSKIIEPRTGRIFMLIEVWSLLFPDSKDLAWWFY